MKGEVLFISHDAGRTGAPMVLLHFLRWFATHGGRPFRILLRSGHGELRRDFEALAPVVAWNEVDGWRARVPGRSDRARARRAARLLGLGRLALVYANTVTNGRLLAALAGYGAPALCHAHEMEYWIRYRTDPAELAAVRRHAARYVAGSRAVEAALVDAMGVPAELIDVVPEFTAARPPVSPDRVAAVRRELGTADGDAIVAGSGTTDWRKGPDLFVQLAGLMKARMPARRVHFVWVGGAYPGPELGALQHDVARLGLEGRVHFVGVRTDPFPYFAAADVFTVTSREDPLPLVSLEAASLGKPVVCFAGAGGAAELVEGGAGFAVGYLDLSAMADTIGRLVKDPGLRSEVGELARRRVGQAHDVAVAGPRLRAIIEGLVRDGPGAAP